MTTRESQVPPLRLRVMTWNIHKGIGGVDRRYDLQRTIEVIEHYDPDIALLQEVAQGIPTLRNDNQVELLAGALHEHAAFHPEHQFKTGGYGNLILSRWPLHDVHHLDLTIGWRKKRGLLQAHSRVRWAGRQRTVVLHNLHLGLAGSERAKQLARFVAHRPFAGLHQSTALIVGGDLNDLWGSLGRRHLVPAGLARAGRLNNTFPAAMPLRPLDGLFYRGSLKVIHAEAARLQLARAASDHVPLIADFELMAENRP